MYAVIYAHALSSFYEMKKQIEQSENSRLTAIKCLQRKEGPLVVSET